MRIRKGLVCLTSELETTGKTENGILSGWKARKCRGLTGADGEVREELRSALVPQEMACRVAFLVFVASRFLGLPWVCLQYLNCRDGTLGLGEAEVRWQYK